MRVTLFRDPPAEGWPSMDRYARELHAALAAVSPCSVEMPTPPDPGARVYPRLARRMLRHPRWARRQQGDVNHVLDQAYGHLLWVLDPARTVVTVHDLAPLHFPGRALGASRAAWRRAWRGLRQARRVICPSAFVAAELRPRLAAGARIHVVPHGVGDAFRPPEPAAAEAVRRRLGAAGRSLLLHVGRIHARKGFDVLLEAVARLRDAGEPIVLVQAGGRPDAETTRRIRARHLDAQVRFAGFVVEDELPTLYGAADAFVFPSRYEGFGLPVLEAMACGAPVVAAAAASLPEVVGDAGLLATPDAAAALAGAVARVLREPGLSAVLRARGLERARAFSWRATAERTWSVYESCLGDAGAPAVAPARANP